MKSFDQKKFKLHARKKKCHLAIFQTGPGWLGTVSAALKNPSQDFKDSFCFGCRWFPTNAGRQNYRGSIFLRFNLVKQQCELALRFYVFSQDCAIKVNGKDTFSHLDTIFADQQWTLLQGAPLGGRRGEGGYHKCTSLITTI